MINHTVVVQTVNEMQKELFRATEKFGEFNSAHEGWAILQEEVDELVQIMKKMWENVKADDYKAAEEEAIQIGAMAIRFIHDLQKGDDRQLVNGDSSTE